jgi:hypothetical protein
MVYVAVPTALFVKPLAAAMALIVSDALTAIGPEYTVEAVVGVDPLIV